MLVTRGSEIGEMGRRWAKCINFQLRGIDSEDLMHMVIIAKNTVLYTLVYTRKLPRVNHNYFYYTHTT